MIQTTTNGKITTTATSTIQYRLWLCKQLMQRPFSKHHRIIVISGSCHILVIVILRLSMKLTIVNLMTVCSCYVTYAFQSESAHCSCLNVKELLARSRRKIWSLSDCNWTRTQNHLVRKQTLNHLARLALLQ